MISLIFLLTLNEFTDKIISLKKDSSNIQIFWFLDKSFSPIFILNRVYYSFNKFEPSPKYSIRSVWILKEDTMRLLKLTTPFEYLEGVAFSPDFSFFLLFLKTSIPRGIEIEKYNLSGNLTFQIQTDIERVFFSDWDFMGNLHIFGYDKDSIFSHVVVSFRKNKIECFKKFYPFERFQGLWSDLSFILCDNLYLSKERVIKNMYTKNEVFFENDTLYVFKIGDKSIRLPLRPKELYLIQRFDKDTLFLKGWVNKSFIEDTLSIQE